MEEWESVTKKPWQHLVEKRYHVIMQKSNSYTRIRRGKIDNVKATSDQLLAAHENYKATLIALGWNRFKADEAADAWLDKQRKQED
jgi:hypothetical protein